MERKIGILAFFARSWNLLQKGAPVPSLSAPDREPYLSLIRAFLILSHFVL
jgi:hypothetical protein